jgi:hypothetical protein
MFPSYIPRRDSEALFGVIAPDDGFIGTTIAIAMLIDSPPLCNHGRGFPAVIALFVEKKMGFPAGFAPKNSLSSGSLLRLRLFGRARGRQKKKSGTPVVGGWVRVRKRTRVRFIFSIFFLSCF